MNAIDRIIGGFGAAEQVSAKIGKRPAPLRRKAAKAARRKIIRTKKASLDLGQSRRPVVKKSRSLWAANITAWI